MPTTTKSNVPSPKGSSRDNLDKLRSLVLAKRWSTPVAISVLAFAIRAIGLTRSNELFIDELTYTRLATTVSNGQLPNLAGKPFLLHPPGAFVLNGLVIKIIGLSGTTMDIAYQLRWVNAILGAAVVGISFLIICRMTSRWTALIAATAIAFDPFILRNDTRVMLETPTTLALLAGWLALVISMTRPEPRLSAVASTSAGLLLGLGILTKDMALVPALLPIAIAVVWRKTIRSRDALIIFCAALTPYTLYVITLTANGLLGQWWTAKISGVERIVGTEQISGFNEPGAPSLLTRLLDQFTRFGTSYILIGVCVFAGVSASLSNNTSRRFIGLITVSTGLLGLYAAVAGTLEEQFGYYVVVTSILSLSVVAAELLSRRRASKGPIACVTIAFVALTIILGIAARFTTDDGYVQVRAWMTANLPTTATVGLTTDTAEFALLPHPYYGVWPSLNSLDAHHAEYALTQDRQLSEGYGYAAPQLLVWLQQNAQPVFAFNGPSTGQTTLWRLDQAIMDRAVAYGVKIPPVNGDYR